MAPGFLLVHTGRGASAPPNFNEIARPDGLRIWEERDAQVTFCLEYDRRTEILERLEKKLKSYEGL
jgi:protein involved in plasmid replication-relaxation